MEPEPRAGSLPPPDHAPPSARDASVFTLLLLALGLLVVSWSRIEGYQLADSVEYMERAQSFARGEAQDPAGGMRSFAFSVLLSPFFWVQDRLGVASERTTVAFVRALQVLFGVGLVLACTRIGARLAGRGAGLVAGLVVACNPVFLQYGVSPVSGVSSALFVALGIDRLLAPPARRNALAGGAWLGAGFLMAYQTIVVATPILLLFALRAGRRGWRRSLSMLAGFAACVLVQVVLDRITWGSWGESLVNYVVANAGSVIVGFLMSLGLRDIAAPIYERVMALQGLEIDTAGGGEVRQLQPKLYYLFEIRSMLVVPVVALLALGTARAFRHARGSGAWILALTLALNVGVMSYKGAKSFRLWLPLLPLIAPLCGVGFATLVGPPGARAAPVRRLAGVLTVAAGLLLGVRTMLALNMRQYGVYWDAMALVNERAASEAQDEPVRVASAYHWAAYARAGPGVELQKLPHHLDQWLGKTMDDARRAACLARLEEVDWLLVHRPILDQDRALFDLVNARFAVEDVLWQEETQPTLGPVFVLRARDGRPGERGFTETLPPEDPWEYRRRLGLDRTLLAPLDFAGQRLGGNGFDVRVTLLGYEYRSFESSGIGWITYHWTAATGLAGDYTVVDRLTPPTGAHAWQNNHGFGYGFRPSSEWVPGQILIESYPVLLGEQPFSDGFRPMGGAYRRGELVPVELWMAVVEFDTDGNYRSSLRPTASGAPRPLDMSRPTPLPGDRRQSAEGYVFSPDNLVRLAAFLAPILARHRWPDDGRGDPP